MTNNRCCSSSCCEQTPSPPGKSGNAAWADGWLNTAAGPVPSIRPHLQLRDMVGTITVRLGINRNNYRIPAGLYAVGSPDHNAPVLVTANYKLTFDSLRKELASQNAWILVLDTKGVNVWCAAGKGTFGTAELNNRINLVQLQKVVSHRRIILPQLGAPGVAAHEVLKNTGFKVLYGPVYAADIVRYLQNNQTATPDMRRIHFNLRDRLAVVPVELNPLLKLIPVMFVLLVIFNAITPAGGGIRAAFLPSLYQLMPFAGATILGTLGIAALLPYIPFRSFAAKGLLLGVLWSAVVIQYRELFLLPDNPLMTAAGILFILSLTSFFSLNFTGSTTYTSLSGVQKETLITVPLVALASLSGLVLSIIYKIQMFSS